MQPLNQLYRVALIVFLVCAALVPAHAQNGPVLPPGTLGAPAANPPEAAPPEVTEDAGTVDDLIRNIEDPARRADLLRTLRGLQVIPAQGQPADGSTAIASTEASFVDGLVDFANERATALSTTFSSLWRQSYDLPALGNWLTEQAANEFRRALWLDIAWGVLKSLVLGLAGWLVARRLIGPVAPPLASGGVRAMAMVLARDLVPLLVFLGVAGGYLDLAALPAAERVGHLVMAAIMIDRVTVILLRRLAPGAAAGRSLRTLVLAMRIGVYGWMLLATAGRLGMPPHFFNVLSAMVFFIAAAVATLGIIEAQLAIERIIRTIAGWIESDLAHALMPLAAWASYGYLFLAAAVWLHYLVWLVDVPGGFWFLIRADLITVGVFVAGQLLLNRLDRGMVTPVQVTEVEGDAGETTRTVVRPPMIRFCRLIIKLVSFALILEAWGLGMLGWLGSSGGEATLRVLSRVLVMVAVASVLWLIVDRICRAYLDARDVEGAPVLGNRGRTLTTIARSVILLLIAATTLITALREIGIDTGPLLAGAGVVGLAVGFGAQTLVKDIITGLFILLGDTLRVGDVVDLGGRSGVVESMNMRAATLRGYNGDVITVPYSAIDVVTNMTRDFSFWVIDLGISYSESSERVIQVLKEVTDQMRREWPWRRLILEPLDVAGLDRFDQWSLGVRARIKTRPGDQWRVGRELNRRLKQRFDELGIRIPFPQSVVHVAGSGDDAQPVAAAAPAALTSAASGRR